MNKQEQKQFFESFVQSMGDIMLKKGDDYSNEDRLSNFKLSGAIIGQSGEQCCLNLISVKVARLGQLVGTGKTPNNESINDTLLDLANYTLLLAMLIEESNPLGLSDEEIKSNIPKDPMDDLHF